MARNQGNKFVRDCKLPGKQTVMVKTGICPMKNNAINTCRLSKVKKREPYVPKAESITKN